MKKINKKNIIAFIKKNKYYEIVFIFTLCLSILIPLSGDDLGNYMPNMTIKTSIINAIKDYYTYESRIVSRFLINLLCYYKWIWDILNAIALTSIYWSITKLLNVKNKTGYYLCFIIIFAIPCAMFGQVYAWVTGSITYLFPAAIIITYITYLFKYNAKFNYKKYIILLLINFITPFFIDNCGVPLLIGNILYTIYIKNKKHVLSKSMISYIIVSLIALILVYISPGSANRLSNASKFAQLSLINKIIYNLPTFIDYLFYANPLVILLTYIPICYLISNLLNKRKFYKYFGIILLSIIPVYSIIYDIYMYNPFIEYTSSLDFYWITNSAILRSNIAYIFWYFYLLLFVYSIFKIYNNNWLYIILIIIGLSSNFAMLLRQMVISGGTIKEIIIMLLILVQRRKLTILSRR